jgi:hypothetical protein
MFHSVDRSSPKATSFKMAARVPPLPETPFIASQKDIKGKQPKLTPLYLPPSESESSSSTSSPGATPIKLRTAYEILAEAKEGFEAATMAATPTTLSSNTSKRDSGASKVSTSTAVSNSAPDFSANFDTKEADEEAMEKKVWLEHYTNAQPTGMLLKTTDFEYVELKRVYREDQERLGIKKKEEAKVQAAQAEKKKEKEKKKCEAKEKKAKWYRLKLTR